MENYSDLVLVAQLHEIEEIFSFYNVLWLFCFVILPVSILNFCLLLLLQVSSWLLVFLCRLHWGLWLFFCVFSLCSWFGVDFYERQVVFDHLLCLFLQFVRKFMDILSLS